MKPLVHSSGFVAPIPLGGTGKAGKRLGFFTATMKCGDVTVTGNLLIQLGSTRWISVHPDPVEPGGEITVSGFCPYGGEVTAKSPGFAAPIRVQFGGSAGYGGGQGKAAKKPGRYTTSVQCKSPGSPGPGEQLETTFTILGDPDPGNPPEKTKKPAQVVQKPKGAAETGGGFTAG